MKNTKGISMISLVIVIIVMIILIGIATTAGYRYITESDRVKAEAVTGVVSEAAYRRQNDLSSGVAVAYYEGYSFVVDGTDNETRYAKITGLPADDIKDSDGNTNSDGIPDCLQEEGANWYLFDAESAKALGVPQSDTFITRNISYPAGIDEDEVTLVLADYASGKGYLVNMPTDLLTDSIRQNAGCLNSPNGNHSFKIIATCTKPALCIYCGEEDPLTPALGHDFSEPTCTASGSCRRCGELDPDNGPLGHLMIMNSNMSNTELIEKLNKRDYRIYVNTAGPADSNTTAAWITNAVKHWHECIRCGDKRDEKEHNKGEVPVDSDYHYTLCSECGWQSIKAKHTYTYTSLTDNTHLRKCKICLYEETHSDTGWQPDQAEYHYRICNESDTCYDGTLVINGVTTKVLFKEAHYDMDFDLYCDVCGRCLDREPPKAFDSKEEYYGKMIDATTSTITVEAYTEDEGVGVDYYQFGFVNRNTGTIEWSEKVYPSDTSSPARKTYDNLKSETEYTIYVKAADKSGNFTAPYKIPNTKTIGFPEFEGLTNIPDDYVKGPIYAGIKPIDTDATDLVIKYSLDNGSTWKNIPIAEITTATITLTKEIEVVQIKLADLSSAGNESEIWEYTIEKIDATPPTVAIAAKDGDNNEEMAAYHVAKITIADAKSGIAPDTEVRYAWSISNTVAPTDFTTVYTKNYENASSVSFEVITPADVAGTYYLWVLEGVEDRVGNATTKAVCSGISFYIDDEDVTVSNIRMEDLSPAVDKEYLFVKTGGVVTVSFETSKELGEDPTVTINEQEVTMTTASDGLNHRGTITITDTFAEGELNLRISNIISETGKVSSESYTNEDLTYGPVIYDRTLPAFEYISKQ